MQEGKLTGPYVENPQEVDLGDPSKYFGEMQMNIQVLGNHFYATLELFPKP